MLFFGHNAPRSGARNLARGTRFLRTPGNNRRSTSAPRPGCEESSTPFRGAVPGFGYIPDVFKKRVRLANIPRLRRARMYLSFLTMLLFAVIGLAQVDEAREAIDRGEYVRAVNILSE